MLKLKLGRLGVKRNKSGKRGRIFFFYSYFYIFFIQVIHLEINYAV